MSDNINRTPPSLAERGTLTTATAGFQVREGNTSLSYSLEGTGGATWIEEQANRRESVYLLTPEFARSWNDRGHLTLRGNVSRQLSESAWEEFQQTRRIILTRSLSLAGERSSRDGSRLSASVRADRTTDGSSKSTSWNLAGGFLQRLERTLNLAGDASLTSGWEEDTSREWDQASLLLSLREILRPGTTLGEEIHWASSKTSLAFTVSTTRTDVLGIRLFLENRPSPNFRSRIDLGSEGLKLEEAERKWGWEAGYSADAALATGLLGKLTADHRITILRGSDGAPVWNRATSGEMEINWLLSSTLVLSSSIRAATIRFTEESTGLPPGQKRRDDRFRSRIGLDLTPGKNTKAGFGFSFESVESNFDSVDLQENKLDLSLTLTL